MLEETERRLVKEVYTSFGMYVHSSRSFESIYSCEFVAVSISGVGVPVHRVLAKQCVYYNGWSGLPRAPRVPEHSVDAPSAPCLLLRMRQLEPFEIPWCPA